MTKEEMTKKFLLVDMEEALISNENMPIIGTQALATCLGVLIYSEKERKAIVAHFSTEWYKTSRRLFNILADNIEVDDFKYVLIPGYYGMNLETAYNVKSLLEGSPFCFKKMNIDLSHGVQVDENTCSLEFAFDSLNGKFVTDKVYFGKEYYDINRVRKV